MNQVYLLQKVSLRSHAPLGEGRVRDGPFFSVLAVAPAVNGLRAGLRVLEEAGANAEHRSTVSVSQRSRSTDALFFRARPQEAGGCAEPQRRGHLLSPAGSLPDPRPQRERRLPARALCSLRTRLGSSWETRRGGRRWGRRAGRGQQAAACAPCAFKT